MRVVTEEYLKSLVESIVRGRKKQSELKHQEFVGLTGEELVREINAQLGENWVVKEEDKVKFSKEDINAVANGRFYRRTGVKMVMALIIILLSLATAMKYIPNVTIVGYNIFYTLLGGIALAFIYIYSRKQSKVRKELWKQIGRDDVKEGR